MSEISEINPESGESSRRLSIYSQIHSKSLGDFCLNLAKWAHPRYGDEANIQMPKATIPKAEAQGITYDRDLRLEYVKVREMKLRPELLLALNALGTTVRDNLSGAVPDLFKPQQLTIARPKVIFYEDTEQTFVALKFEEDDAQKVYAQREDTVDCLEKTAQQHELDWTFRIPDVRVAYFKAGVLTEIQGKALEKSMSSAFPMKVIAGAAKMPYFGNMDLGGLPSQEVAA